MNANTSPGDARLVRRAVGLFLGICVLYAVGFVFDVMNAERPYDLLAPFLFHALTISFPLVGVLIARRQPRNAITWILLGIGVAWGLGAAAEGYRTYALTTSPGSLPAADVVDAATAWLWVPGIVPAATLLLLLFPDGRLPSPRWRWVVRLTGVVLVTVSLAVMFAPATLESDGFPGLANPLGIPALRPLFAGLQVFLIGIPVCMILSAVALVQRFRRSRGVERLQLKWLSTAAAIVAVLYAVTLLASVAEPWNQADTAPWASVLQNVALASFALIPIAIGVSILRYRLYDIDRLISRAVSYAIVTAVLVAVYAAVVVGLGTAFGRSGNPVLIAGATLLVAGLFGPLRRRVQGAVDHRFNRRRYDAERVLGAFSSRLRDELDLDALALELTTTASSAVQPASVGVWLRTRGPAT